MAFVIFNILGALLPLVMKITIFLLKCYVSSPGQGIHEAAKQAEVSKGARPGLANKIMIVFTDGWQNKGPVSLANSNKLCINKKRTRPKNQKQQRLLASKSTRFRLW